MRKPILRRTGSGHGYSLLLYSFVSYMGEWGLLLPLRNGLAQAGGYIAVAKHDRRIIWRP